MITDSSTAPPPAIPQFNLAAILLLFAWPALWFTLLIYGSALYLIPAGSTTPTWITMLVIVLGNGAEALVGLAILRREGLCLGTFGLRGRIRLRPPQGRRAWLIAALVFAAGFTLSILAEPLNRALADVPGFVPPAWWGPRANPTVHLGGVAEAFPDVRLPGNLAFFFVWTFVGLFFNVCGEEFYYRGVLLPRMRAVFGRADWIANGLLFTLKHFYQRWLYPGIAAGGLCFAFAAGPLGSLPLAILYHWAGNFLIQTVLLLQAVLGAG